MKLTQQINEIPYQYLAIGILVGFLAPYAWELWNSQQETAKVKEPVAE
jgi:hypothetical protein